MSIEQVKQVLSQYGLSETLVEELTQVLHHNNQFLNESHNAELLEVNRVHLDKIQTLEEQITAYESYVQDEHEAELNELKAKIAEYERYAQETHESEIDELKEQIAAYEDYVQGEHQKLHEQIKLYESYALREYHTLQESQVLQTERMARLLSEKASRYIETAIGEMVDQMDSYAQLVVEKFISDKQTLIESVQNNVRSQEAMMKVKHLLEQYYYTVSPPKESKPLMNEQKNMAKLYNGLLSKYTEAKRDISKLKRQQLIQEQLKGANLSVIQEERVHRYMQDYPEHKTPDEFVSYIKLIVEDVKKKKDAPKVLTESLPKFNTSEVQFNYTPAIDKSKIAQWAEKF